MASASSITVETINRMTKEGRKLEYVLSVIQQPHRARACGSGAKSSADRRPVDPPPVVELRIFEGEGNEKTDITFSYNANFFLFATLEQARAIAHGRVQAAPQQPPVLTGMPVSGMAYLDRPNEAGYFIFPDLSVRHEGLYKLSFNLYEETKEEKDADMEPKSESNKPQVPGVGPESSFDWRLEVKSVPFTVYSAKKFPGLTESTLLSRTVAEQGCRVRIRRDVRMRRREEKGNGAYDEAEDYSRGRQMEDSYKRDASPSPISEGARQPHIADRRMSSDYHQAGPQGHSNYGREPQPQYTQPQYQAPSYQAPPPPQFQQQASYGPPPPQHPAYGREFPQSAAPSHPPRERVYEEDYRRASASYGPPAAPLYPDSRGSNAYQHPPPPNVQGSLSLPPLRMPPPHEFKRDVPSSPMGQLSSISRLPQYTSPNSYDRSQDRPMHNYPTPAALAPSTPIENTRNGKRTYGSVFSASAARENEPLFNGMRPTNLQADVSPFDDDDDSMMVEQMKMSYKRADGSSCNRELPVLD